MRGLAIARGLALLGLTSVGLSGCISYHQEVAALRMPLPTAPSQYLAAYAPPDVDYPSIGGNILKGTSPKTEAAYDATLGGNVPPPPPSPRPPDTGKP